MDYIDYYKKQGAKRNIPENPTDLPKSSPDPPRLDYSVIQWLHAIYPLRRYAKELIGNPGFAMFAACDEGRYEVIDRLEAEFNRQHKAKLEDDVI